MDFSLDASALDAIVRANRVVAPDPELRYHGGPLDGQVNTWPAEAVPAHIQVHRGNGQIEGYVLAGGADDPDLYYRWVPSD
ncbi:hypothetical protein [Streptomyces sp. NPDC059816]|uniref:hypothetical protein n=1 Tax=Streptomyces sp. NPDC059816 TaxID=3346960 RepID=UPI003646A618